MKVELSEIETESSNFTVRTFYYAYKMTPTVQRP